MAPGSAEPFPDPGHRRDREWPGMLNQQIDNPHQVVAANGQTMGAVTAFDLIFYHGTGR